MIYLLLFAEFFIIGLFTFGGGYAMIPLIKEVVLKYDWMSEEAFYDFIGVCESTPGPVAVNMATYIGATQGGVLGAILATLGVIMPAFIIMILVVVVLKNVIKNKYVQQALKGINAVVLGLILSTGLIMLYNLAGIGTIDTINIDYLSIIIFIIVLVVYLLYKVIFKKKMPILLLILVSAIIGVVGCLILTPIL